MKTLRNFEVAGAIYLGDGVTEAKVGDQVKLYLDQDAVPGLPEYTLGVIQHPVVKVDCGSKTSYSIEYNEADLDGFLESLRSDDVTNWEAVSAVDVLSDALAAEEAARIAADALLVPKTTTVNGKALSGNITLTFGDIGTLTEVGSGLTFYNYRDPDYGNVLSSDVDGIVDSDGNLPQVLLPRFNGRLALTSRTDSAPDKLIASTPPIFPSYTVAGLPPAADNQYGRAFVTDRDPLGVPWFSAIGATVGSGGGSEKAPVWSDGNNWKIG